MGAQGRCLGAPHPVPFPFSQPDFGVARRGRHFRDSGCSRLGSACCFLPVSPTLPPSRPSPSPCPHSFITLSFLPFAASCPFDALVLFCVRTFPSLFPLFQGLWAFLLIRFFCFYSPSSCFLLQPLLFLPDFLWAALALNSLPRCSCITYIWPFSLSCPSSASSGRKEG